MMLVFLTKVGHFYFSDPPILPALYDYLSLEQPSSTTFINFTGVKLY